MTDVCLQCGVDGGEYDHLCEKCYRERTKPSTLPDVLKMKICSTCSYMVNFGTNQRIVEWEKGIGQLVEENLSLADGATLGDIQIARNERDDYLMYLDVTTDVLLRELEFEEKHTSEMRITYGVCNRCSRQSGNYYECTLQFRGGRRPLTEDELGFTMEYVTRRIEESNSENAFISSMGQAHKGLDFSLGDKTLGKDIARGLKQHFGAQFTESFSIAGRKDGIDIYRSTFLIRLPDIRSGDIVRYRERVYQVVHIRDKSTGIRDLATAVDQNVSVRETSDLQLIHGDEVEAVVVSATDGEAQVLDPVNFSTVTVITPRDLSSGETARFFRCEDGLFLLPEKKMTEIPQRGGPIDDRKGDPRIG